MAAGHAFFLDRFSFVIAGLHCVLCRKQVSIMNILYDVCYLSRRREVVISQRS